MPHKTRWQDGQPCSPVYEEAASDLMHGRMWASRAGGLLLKESLGNKQLESDYSECPGGDGTLPDAMDLDLLSEGGDGMGTVEPPLIVLDKRKGDNPEMRLSDGVGVEQGKQWGEGGRHGILDSSDEGSQNDAFDSVGPDMTEEDSQSSRRRRGPSSGTLSTNELEMLHLAHDSISRVSSGLSKGAATTSKNRLTLEEYQARKLFLTKSVARASSMSSNASMLSDTDASHASSSIDRLMIKNHMYQKSRKQLVPSRNHYRHIYSIPVATSFMVPVAGLAGLATIFWREAGGSVAILDATKGLLRRIPSAIKFLSTGMSIGVALRLRVGQKHQSALDDFDQFSRTSSIASNGTVESDRGSVGNVIKSRNSVKMNLEIEELCSALQTSIREVGQLQGVANDGMMSEIPLIVAKGPELLIVSVNRALSDVLLWDNEEAPPVQYVHELMHRSLVEAHARWMERAAREDSLPGSLIHPLRNVEILRADGTYTRVNLSIGQFTKDRPVGGSNTLFYALIWPIKSVQNCSFGSRSSMESMSSSSSKSSNPWSAAAGHIYGARVARSITSGNLPQPETYNHVSVLFMDMLEYKDMVHNCEMSRMSKWMENVHSIIDGAIADHCVRKVETRGDAYILVAGSNSDEGDSSNTQVSRLIAFATQVGRQLLELDTPTHIRVGIATGPLTIAYIRTQNPAPDMCAFGDTMNTSARMEQSCRPGFIHLTERSAIELCEEKRGEWGDVNPPIDWMNIKGKGRFATVWYDWHKQGFVSPEPMRKASVVSMSAAKVLLTRMGEGAASIFGTNGGSAPSSPVSGMMKRHRKRLPPKLHLSSNVNGDEEHEVVEFSGVDSLDLTPISNAASHSSYSDPAHTQVSRTASAPLSSPDELYLGARSISVTHEQSPEAHLGMGVAARCTSDSFLPEHEPVIFGSIAGSISPQSPLNEYVRHLTDGRDERESDGIEAWTRQDGALDQRGDGAEDEVHLADPAAVERASATTM